MNGIKLNKIQIQKFNYRPAEKERSFVCVWKFWCR